jgi:hypothetical protein
MFNPRRMETFELPFGGAQVLDSAQNVVAETETVDDANLFRCAPDMHQFIVDLLDSRIPLGRFRDEAERLRHRAEGISE